mgnify:CR=1 FL=1
MSRSQLNALVTEKALHFVSIARNADLLDILERKDVIHAVEMKNICAKVSVELASEIDRVIGVLGVSKRRFLEAAFIDAVNQANEIMFQEGVFDAIEDRTAVSPIHLGDN